ncbi:MAG: hypothetical protein QUS12_03005, partial [Methanosarcina sp.]|nr:hypothetical protein [Methanosarcina sp.]
MGQEYITFKVKPCNDYKNHSLKVKKWLAETKGIERRYYDVINILNETEKAYKIAFEDVGIVSEEY